jgi:putative SOS response-associated peptidase YedK
MLKSGEPFCFAGLWERWIKPPSSGQPDTDLEEAPPSQIIESFTIITTQANEAIAPLHQRPHLCRHSVVSNDTDCPQTRRAGNLVWC